MSFQVRFADTDGFTLIELLITMAVFSIVATALLGIYISQSKAEVVQSQLVDMQQNLRTGLSFMARTMRPAGYKLPGSSVDAGVVAASPAQVQFTMDIEEPFGVIASTGETVKFGFTARNDADGNGVADGGRAQLGWNNGGGAGLQPFIDGIEAVGFAYAFDSDGDGVLETTAGGNLLWAMDTNADGLLDTHLDTNDDGVIDSNDAAAGAALPSVLPPLSDIRAVQIWLLARSAIADPGYTEPAGTQYVVANRRIPGNNGFRRQLATTIVKLRNM